MSNFYNIGYMSYWILQSAGLDTKLATNGHYTVFAPNNDVFTGLPAGSVDYFRSTQVRPLYIFAKYVIAQSFLWNFSMKWHSF